MQNVLEDIFLDIMTSLLARAYYIAHQAPTLRSDAFLLPLFHKEIMHSASC